MIDLVGRRALTIAAEHLSTEPLLVGRALTLQDLLPYVRREVALASLASGEQILALRGALSDEAVRSFEQMGVTVTKQKRVVLLSSGPLPQDFAWDAHLRLTVSSVLPNAGGRVRLDGRNLPLFITDRGISFGAVAGKSLPALPASTIAYHPFTADEANLSGYVASLSGFGLSPSMRTLLIGKSGSITLTSDEAGIGYKLTINSATESQILAELLQSSVALAGPTTRSFTLTDGTVIDELNADVSEVAMKVEDVEGGVLVSADQGEIHLRALKAAEETIITNRPELLGEVVKEARLVPVCGTAGTAILLPEKLLTSVLTDASAHRIAGQFMTAFKEIHLLKGKMRFCW